MRISLYEPDIPQNTGTMLRLAACLGLEVHIIEPAGFPVSDRAFRRAGMDYLDEVVLTRHRSWAEFERWRGKHSLRLVLFTTKAATSYLDHRYQAADILLFGRRCAATRADAPRHALDQCGDDLRDGGGRGLETGGLRFSALAGGRS
jgi:tRNA (cytidine/uridine-2'-O-)-methyltransferase